MTSPIQTHWIKDYNRYFPVSSQDAHWGMSQAGFNLSLTGMVYLTDNRPLRGVERDIDIESAYPCHRDLIVGDGDDCTIYSGIYSWGKQTALWLYPQAEQVLNDAMKRGMASLIGVHQIAADTPVISNTSRKVLFRLGEVELCRLAVPTYLIEPMAAPTSKSIVTPT